MKLIGICAAALLVVAGLSGCAAQAPAIHLAGGTTSCVPDGKAKPGLIAAAFHNTTGGAITVTHASVGGANIKSDEAWLLDAKTKEHGAVGYGVQPFSLTPEWSTRRKVGAAKLAAGDWASIAVSFTFPSGVADGAQVEGITMKYRTENGATGTATSNAVGSYSAEC